MRNSPRSIDKKRAKTSKEHPNNGNITESAANIRMQPLPDSQSESKKQKQEPKISSNNSKSKVIVKEEEDKDNDDLLLTTKFPMNRINRIVRSGAADDMRLTQEAVFLINKSSECFLDLLGEEAYAGAIQDHKNYIAYKNLSSIVSKQRRYDFLSDFIPEKIKAGDALEERKSAGA